eukprot:TRINITY_DN2926_c0_g1_i1.p1 TRINITY_DN2926_c0_g1~~TRINITY_DN2926_c0_g1_i1.p1  ORF type:complete len:170 (-),score=31.22 TRINITY_DN2926_c0_g1_i1:205-714(-)
MGIINISSSKGKQNLNRITKGSIQQMKLEDIIKYYITPIRKFENLGPNPSGKDIYNYFRSQAHFEDIESFIVPRFERKARDLAEGQEQYDFLQDKAKEISRLSQRLFEAKFPKYFQHDASSKFRKSLDQVWLGHERDTHWHCITRCCKFLRTLKICVPSLPLHFAVVLH